MSERHLLRRRDGQGSLLFLDLTSLSPALGDGEVGIAAAVGRGDPGWWGSLGLATRPTAAASVVRQGEP
eukprot:3259361-Alexandrium_andersonii.AAC.1